MLYFLNFHHALSVWTWSHFKMWWKPLFCSSRWINILQSLVLSFLLFCTVLTIHYFQLIKTFDLYCKLLISYSTIQSPFKPIKNFGNDLKDHRGVPISKKWNHHLVHLIESDVHKIDLKLHMPTKKSKFIITAYKIINFI